MFIVICIHAAYVPTQVLYHGHFAILAVVSQIRCAPTQRHPRDVVGFLDAGRKEDADHGVINNACVYRLF